MKSFIYDSAIALLVTAALFFIVPAGMILLAPAAMDAPAAKHVAWTWVDAGMMETAPEEAPPSSSTSSPDIAQTPPLNLEPLPLADVSLDALPIIAVSLPHVAVGLGGLDNASGVLSSAAYPLAPLNPTYPSSARSRGVEGIVMVEFLVDTNGRTKDIVIVEATPEGVFNEAVLRAVRQWRFSPALHKDGKHVPVRFRQTVRFALKGISQM